MKKLILFLFLLTLFGCTKGIPNCCAYCHEEGDEFKIIGTICDSEDQVKREIARIEHNSKTKLVCRFDYE